MPSADNTARVWELLGATTPPPNWLADFLRIVAQLKFDDGGELVVMPPAEFLTLRKGLAGIVAKESSRYADTVRYFLTLL